VRIKEVSQITGLTEKTIRFYEEKQLIQPEQTEINGRIFRSYTEQNIAQLNLVAVLRKLDFAISDILSMQDDPGSISEILKGYQEKTAADLAFKADVMEKLKEVEYSAVSSVWDLGEYLKGIAEDRPLPAADVELQFYRIDGLTKEEIDGEVKGYYERISMAHERKDRRKTVWNVALYIASIVLIMILGLLTWRNIHYLGYIPAYQDDLGWKWLLIPLFGLLMGAVTYFFTKSLQRKSEKGESSAPDSKGFRLTALVLSFSLMIGVFASLQSFKTLARLKEEAGLAARQEWYTLYRMTQFVQMDYLDSDERKMGDSGLVTYVNQTCYNYPFNNNDRLHTRMHDMLIWSYDLLFRELQDTDFKATPEQRDRMENMLAEINRELMQISKEILDMPDSELAELTRYDNKAGEGLRSLINLMVLKYTEATDNLFRSIN